MVYPNLNAGTAGWSPIATFTQNSYGDFDAVNGAYSVTYTGSYAFAPGTYWVGVAAVTGSPGYHAAQGIQPSPWTWDTNPGNELLTINTGSTWATYSFSASPMITLLIPSLDVNGGSTSSAPADLLQQIAVPSSGTCADVQDESLRWGTGLSGGWQLTWAQWMNAGKGGAVCTRTLVYGTALGRWVVG